MTAHLLSSQREFKQSPFRVGGTYTPRIRAITLYLLRPTARSIDTRCLFVQHNKAGQTTVFFIPLPIAFSPPPVTFSSASSSPSTDRPSPFRPPHSKEPSPFPPPLLMGIRAPAHSQIHKPSPSPSKRPTIFPSLPPLSPNHSTRPPAGSSTLKPSHPISVQFIQMPVPSPLLSLLYPPLPPRRPFLPKPSTSSSSHLPAPQPSQSAQNLNVH